MKYELIITENDLPSFGIAIGTVYEIGEKKQIKLHNLGYYQKTQEFYYNENIHLSKKVIRYFDGKTICDELIKAMNEIEIYSVQEVYKLIAEYDELKVRKELVKQKIMTIKRDKKFKSIKSN